MSFRLMIALQFQATKESESVHKRLVSGGHHIIMSSVAPTIPKIHRHRAYRRRWRWVAAAVAMVFIKSTESPKRYNSIYT